MKQVIDFLIAHQDNRMKIHCLVFMVPHVEFTQEGKMVVLGYIWVNGYSQLYYEAMRKELNILYQYKEMFNERNNEDE